MCEGHVPRPEMVKAPQNGHAGSYAVAAFDPDQARDDPVLVCLLELAARRDEPHLGRVLGSEPPHHVDLLEGELDCVQKLGLARHVGGPELRPYDASSQPDQVRLPTRAPGRVFRQVDVEREVSKVRVSTLLAQVPGEIVVSVKIKDRVSLP